MQANYIVMFSLAVFFSALSQVLLKVSANKEYRSTLHDYFNVHVISAYVIFLGCVLVNSIAYRGIQLKHGAILETLGYVYVLILDKVFFKQKITYNKVIGSLIIIVGIIIFFL